MVGVIRYESDEGGDTVQLTPERIHPFGIEALEKLEKDGRAAIDLTIEARNPIVNGETQQGWGTAKTAMSFREKPTIFALVPGGWLPAPLAMPPKFLVDRNVVVNLEKIRNGESLICGQQLEWWLDLFRSADTFFNPLPYAIEGHKRRAPTREEFESDFMRGSEEIRRALPHCSVAGFDKQSFDTAYSAFVSKLEERNEREASFLLEAVPMVRLTVSRKDQDRVLSGVLEAADKGGVEKHSLVVLSVLSCLYESPEGGSKSPGRRIIKPSASFSAEDAHNAISDLRHIELAAAGQTFFGQDPFALCTQDVGVAVLWCALNLRGEIGDKGWAVLNFDLSNALFPRLSEAERVGLHEKLTCAQAV